MKKRYLIITILLLLCCITKVSALTIGDCEVLVSFKRNSSLDVQSYVCKNTQFGSSTDSIYYDGTNNTVKLNNFNAYYFTNYENNDVTIDITGTNEIGMLHITSGTKFNVTGNGSLKFKEDSFVKKVESGDSIYQFVYKGKTIVNDDNEIYEGTILNFEKDYSSLIDKNVLPFEYNLEDYSMVQAIDFVKQVSVTVTESWLEQHINTNLNKSVESGFGIIKYVEPAPEEKKVDNSDKTLETENVIFVSDKKVGKKYKLKVNDLKNEEIASSVEEQIDKALLSLLDVSVYNGKKEVSMKDGKYTIKIKMDDSFLDYQDFQVIYVSDDGEVKEYIDATFEDGYLVFVTSHLSQYGIIATEKPEEIVVEPLVIENNTNIFTIKNAFKVSILLVVIIGYFVAMAILIYKGRLYKRIRKRRTF